MQSAEDAFLDRLSRGQIVTQDEYDQLLDSIPPEGLAAALAMRFQQTGQTQALVEAARLYQRAGLVYEALEVCSRSPRVHSLKQMIQKSLPEIRSAYPGTSLVGKLLDEALLVIDLNTGKIIRFPPILPATMLEDTPAG